MSFPVKALKILVHDLQSGGESATFNAAGNAADLEEDDDVCSEFLLGISWKLMRYF